MASYKLNISHNNINEEISYSEAIDLLNNYKKHRSGQPLVIIYYDENNNRQLLFAVGKRDFTDPLDDGRINGEEFYEIVNKNNIGESSQIMFVKNGDIYIRGIDYTGARSDYKILNERSINEQLNDQDIVTNGYLKVWSSFQNINN